MTAAVLIAAAAMFSLLVVAGGWAQARGYRRGRTARRCHGQMDLVGVKLAVPQPAVDDDDWFGTWVGVFPAWFTDERISEDDAA